ncbi:MAG: DUF4190 domain-containing protein [Phycisphaerae bacterium]
MSQSPATSGSQSKEPARPKTSGLAVAGMLLSLGGLIGGLLMPAAALALVPADAAGRGIVLIAASLVVSAGCGVLGLILGIAAVRAVGARPGELKGKGLAVASILISVVDLALAAMLITAMLGARVQARGASSMNNVRQLALAARVYAAQHDQKFPPPDSWPEALRNYGIDDGILADPSEMDAGRAYAMNARLSDFPLSAVRSAGRTVLFFECRFGAPPGGGPELLPDQPRHPGGYVIGFVDGHVEGVAPQETDDLIWDPDREP